MGNRALIITPTGCPIMEHEDYEKGKHWRMAHAERTYDTCVVVFKDDFVPEPGTYDMLIRKKGYKYKLIPQIANMIKWENYDYIGCWDDDYATDIKSVNRSLQLAREYDFRFFQQAVTSFNTFPCLRHNPEYLFTETNFVESGIVFFRNDIFRKLLAFLNEYEYNESEWGIDKILSYLFQGTAHVVHEVTARHMREDESWYDKANAFKEMDYLMKDFFPKYMMKEYGIEYKYTDIQQEYRAYKRA
jgi:hypothetical protein